MTDDELESALNQAADWLRLAERVCVLTGAGVSAESGVPEGFERDPDLVWNFYNLRRANVATVKPNPGHAALVELEDRWGDRFTLVTQNVDGLHLDAGSRRVLEIHGSLRQTRCLACEAVANRGLEPLGDAPQCPQCGGRLRPHIVWFGEGLPEDVWSAAMVAAFECNVFLVVGTSAVVHPAASLIPISKRHKAIPAKVIEVNLTPTDASVYADVGLYGPSGEMLPKLVRKLGERGA